MKEEPVYGIDAVKELEEALQEEIRKGQLVSILMIWLIMDI